MIYNYEKRSDRGVLENVFLVRSVVIRPFEGRLFVCREGGWDACYWDCGRKKWVAFGRWVEAKGFELSHGGGIVGESLLTGPL